MTVLIPNLAIGGYRSFGSVQHFERFAKINLFIGQNNSGKSNVLLFLNEIFQHASHAKYPESPLPAIAKKKNLRHQSQRILPTILGVADGSTVVQKNENIKKSARLRSIVETVLGTLKSNGQCGQNWTYYSVFSDLAVHNLDTFTRAVDALSDTDLYELWKALFPQKSRGGRKEHWLPETVPRFYGSLNPHSVRVVPAIRQIQPGTTEELELDGSGIIEQLVKLQNPDSSEQGHRQLFRNINSFVQSVLSNAEAQIEISHKRDTIVVHMNGRSLPIEALGTGVQEVIMLATAGTVLHNYVLCIEEPELHLNPILIRKLTRYLSEKTNNQYFIATHSTVLMDTPGAEVYHVRLENGESVVARVTTDAKKAAVCTDLGYHPSDLMQSNCVIWVEGPSDRLYINWWLKNIDEDLLEGVHYSIMFYGGGLRSHLTALDLDDHEFAKELISLIRINRRVAVVIDSDREKARGKINENKKRLQDELKGRGMCWITKGREIENYLLADQLDEATASVRPGCKRVYKDGTYDRMLAIKTKKGKDDTASKVKVAHHIVDNYQPNLDIHDLGARLAELRDYIRASNPEFKSEPAAKTSPMTSK